MELSANDSISADLFPCLSPRHPEKSTLRDRLVTFLHTWGAIALLKPKPREIAKAGLYSIGDGDKVKCYYCNGGLQNWRDGDDPWLEHAKWYPNCEFLLRSKGLDYVARVSSLYPNLNRPVLVPTPARQTNTASTASATTHCRTAAHLNEQPASNYPIVAADSLTSNPGVANRPDSMPSTSRQRNTSPCGQLTVNTNVLQSVRSGSHVAADSIKSSVVEFLSSEVAKKTNGLGYARDSIQTVAEIQLRQTGRHFNNCSELVDALMEYQKREIENADLYSSAEDEEHIPSPTSSAEFSRQVAGQLGHVSISVDVEVARKEIDSIEQEKRCKICLDSDSNCVLVSCGHVCCCTECVGGLRVCPICRKKIDKAVKFYRSKK